MRCPFACSWKTWSITVFLKCIHMIGFPAQLPEWLILSNMIARGRDNHNTIDFTSPSQNSIAPNQKIKYIHHFGKWIKPLASQMAIWIPNYDLFLFSSLSALDVGKVKWRVSPQKIRLSWWHIPGWQEMWTGIPSVRDKQWIWVSHLLCDCSSD